MEFNFKICLWHTGSMFYVYLLQSKKDNNYYIGQANYIKKRLQEHNDGLVKATRHRRPFRLIGYETYQTRNEARWREYNLKKSACQRKKFISDLMDRRSRGLKN